MSHKSETNGATRRRGPTPRLTARLRGILELVPEGDRVADIGSGHGMLALALAARGQQVVATERTPGMMARLRRDIAAATYESSRMRGLPGFATVEPRRGDGLGPIAAGEVETAVIAGLGGHSVVRILEAAAWLPRCLVLQPMQDAEIVAGWIGEKSWPAKRSLIHERGRAYHAWRVEVPAPERAVGPVG